MSGLLSTRVARLERAMGTESSHANRLISLAYPSRRVIQNDASDDTPRPS